MNLYEFLDTYQTSPVLEINKIKSILERTEYISGLGRYSLKDVFDIVYSESSFASHEPNIDDFLNNIVLRDYREDNEIGAITNYRYLCEFLFALIELDMNYDFQSYFGEHIRQLKNIMMAGLEKSGYTIVPYGNHTVTKKKDDQAESIAATNGEFRVNIMDYLLAKTTSEKEKVLTLLANQLEATQPKDCYSKQNRELVQLLRHKDEKLKDQRYSWFFEKNEYEKNLDSLFKVYLSIISHDNCHDFLDKFKNNKENK